MLLNIEHACVFNKATHSKIKWQRRGVEKIKNYLQQTMAEKIACVILLLS